MSDWYRSFFSLLDSIKVNEIYNARPVATCNMLGVEMDSDTSCSDTDSDDSDCEPDSASSDEETSLLKIDEVDLGCNSVRVHISLLSDGETIRKRRQYSGQRSNVDMFGDIDFRLTKENVKDNTERIVLFYANWCGYCHAIKDVYLEFKKKHPSLPIYVYHAGDEDSLPSGFTGVNGFPTIAHVVNGSINKSFDQERTVERLAAWANQVLPKTHAESHADSLNTFFTTKLIELTKPISVIETNELNSFPVHVMFFSPTCPPCQKTKDKYNSAAYMYKHDPNHPHNYNTPVYAVNIVTNPSLKERYSINGVPTIAWVTGPGKDDMVHYNGNRDPDDMYGWMKTNRS